MLFRVHSALQEHFCGVIYTKENHDLVDWGPYKYVRYPMYSVMLLAHISTFVATANVMIGGIGIGMLVLVVSVRVLREERILIEKLFGPFSVISRMTTF